MADTLLQIRTNEADKAAAAEILAQLGTNTSAVVNMLLKQIILTRSIPFEISLAGSDAVSGKKISQYRTGDLKAVLSQVSQSVEEIWVFGSTVTPFCRPDSDLDLCIIGFTTLSEEAMMYKAPKCSVDIITETPEGFAKRCLEPGSIYKEVKDKGLLVYKKGVDIKWEK